MNKPTAHDILKAAARHMEDRAATYDKPEGERSMGATVGAFRYVTGHALTEEQGWLFMEILKAVRSQQGAYRADSYADGAAYASLAGEAAARDRQGPVNANTNHVVDPAGAACLAGGTRGPFPHGTGCFLTHPPAPRPDTWEDGEKRMNNIARSHGDGEHYDAVQPAPTFDESANFEPAPEFPRWEVTGRVKSKVTTDCGGLKKDHIYKLALSSMDNAVVIYQDSNRERNTWPRSSFEYLGHKR